jgi:Tfp pilus assembly protein PilX
MARKQKNQKGSALILVLVMILVLSLMGTSLMFLSQSETWSSMNYRMMSQSRYGAESGLSAAAEFIVDPNTYTAPAASSADPLTAYNAAVSPVTYNNAAVVLSTDPNVTSVYPVSSVITAFQNAVGNPGYVMAGGTKVNYTVTATLVSMGTVMSYGSPATVQMWKITADGTINAVKNSKEEVSAVMERQVSPSTVYAAFATANGCGALSFAGGGQTDSYNSTQLTVNAAGVATPPSTFNTYGGNVGSNGNLAENGAKTTIYGTMSTPDTGVGNCSGGNVTAWTDNGNATVSGGLVKLPQIVVFPPPNIPAPGTTNENINNGVTLAPGNYGDISLSGHGALTLTPGIYNINSISEQGANTSVTLGADPTTHLYGQVTLNVAGVNQTTPIDLTGNGLQNPTLNPSDFQINYAGTGTIKIAGNSSSAAVVYAPNASVTLTGGSDFYGAILANTVTDAGGTAIHYDLNLNNTSFIVSNYMLGGFNWAKF